MGKLVFASLHRTKDKKIVFLMRDGRSIPNEQPFVLLSVGAYLEKDENGFPVCWHVVELSSGLSLATGATYNAAVKAAKEKVSEVGVDRIRYLVDKSIKEHGPAPGHRITYL